MPGQFSDTTVVIPTYNEADSIGILIKLLRKHYAGVSIIVCDDGSTDGTIRIAEKHSAAVIDRRAEHHAGVHDREEPGDVSVGLLRQL